MNLLQATPIKPLLAIFGTKNVCFLENLLLVAGVVFSVNVDYHRDPPHFVDFCFKYIYGRHACPLSRMEVPSFVFYLPLSV